VIAVQLVALVALAILARHDGALFAAACVALAGLVAAQALFWTFTFPANQATANWTVLPADWEVLRRRWEYSHLAGAAFQLAGFCALLVGVLARTPGPASR
jgi:hypothetical protein